MNPNTIVSYLPQQYRHVIDGAFDALGMSTKAHGGFATREGEHVNDNYYYEEDFEDDDADSATAEPAGQGGGPGLPFARVDSLWAIYRGPSSA